MATSSDYENSEANNVAGEIEDYPITSPETVIPAELKVVSADDFSNLANGRVSEEIVAAERHRAGLPLYSESVADASDGGRSSEAFEAAQERAYIADIPAAVGAVRLNELHLLQIGGAPSEGAKASQLHIATLDTQSIAHQQTSLLDGDTVVAEAPVERALLPTPSGQGAKITEYSAAEEPLPASGLAMEQAASFPIAVSGTDQGEVLDKRGQSPGGFGYFYFQAKGGDDVVWGSAFGDKIEGGAGADVLIGQDGADTIYGGDDFDWVSYRDDGGPGGVTVNISDNTWSNLAAGTAKDSYGNTDIVLEVEGIVGTAFADKIYAAGITRSVYLQGQAGSDSIWGGNGNDTIEGGWGSDTVYAGDGNDYVYAKAINDSNDITSSDVLYGEAGNDTLEGTTSSALIGGAGDNLLKNGKAIYLGSAHVHADLRVNTIWHQGIDTLVNITQVDSGEADDILIAGSLGVRFNGGGGSDRLVGGIGDDVLKGDMFGYTYGFDTFVGSAGSDQIFGGLSDRAGSGLVDYSSLGGVAVQVDLRTGVVIKNGIGGDQLYDILDITGAAASDSITGNDFENHFVGGDGSDFIEGLGGDDQLRGDGGSDKLYGGKGSDSLWGGTESDILDGGEGDDFMSGGAGDDTYYVDSAGDVIEELLGEGIDTVHTLVSYSLAGTNLENIIADGTNNIDLTGTGGINVLTGNAGNNVLDGGAGADIMIGGDGDDTYIIDSINDLGLRTLLAERNGSAGGVDTAHVYVQNLDARKLDNIENVILHNGVTLNYVAKAPVAVQTGTYKLSVLENQAGNFDVAKIQSTDDGNGGAIEYRLVNDFGGTFQINATTGVITAVKPLNHELTPYFDLQVYAQETDIANGGLPSDVSVIRISVTDVNEKPLGVTYTSAQIAENAGQGAPISSAPNVSDPDVPAAFRQFDFALVDSNNQVITSGPFAISASTGIIERGSLALPDVNVPTEYTVRVRVGDGSGYAYSDVKITVTPVTNNPPGAPIVQGTATPSIKENAGGNVVSVISSDDGNGGALVYKLVNPATSKFEIIYGTNQIRLKAPVDYENDPDIQTINAGQTNEQKYFDVQVYAEESSGLLTSALTTIRIFIENDNEAPTSVSFINAPAGGLQAGSVNAGVSVIKAVASDPDSSWSGLANNKYSFVGGSLVNGKFTINADTGEVTTNDKLTYQDAPTYSLQVVAYDPGKPFLQRIETYTFTVAADTAPTNIHLTTGGVTKSVQEDALVIGTVTADDNGGGANITYSIAANPYFDISATGQITVKAGLNFEDQVPYTAVVTATDSAGLSSASQTITITVTDVNEAASDIDFVGGVSVQAGTTKAGTVIVKAVADDPDVLKPSFQVNKYKFSSGTNGPLEFGNFRINADTGEITTIHDVTAADVSNNVTLSVVAYDGTLSFTDTYVFAITPPGNTAPTNIRLEAGGTSVTLLEKATTVVAQVVADDDGPAANLSYTVANNDPYFSIDSGTGVISIKAGADLDYELAPFYDLVVTVTDGNGVSTQGTIRFDLTDVNEAPLFIQFTPGTTAHVGNGGGIVVATAAAIDADTDPANASNRYRFSNGSQDFGNFHIDAFTGEITTIGTVDAAGTFTLSVISYDAGDATLSVTNPVDIVIDPAPNANPTITVLPNGKVDWPVQDIGTVNPFKDLVFQDAEDGASGASMSVTIFFDPNDGAFDNVLPEHEAAAGMLIISGNQQYVNDIVRSLTFNPHNRPTEPGVVRTTDFTIDVVDSAGGMQNDFHVSVAATASGSPDDNLAPSILVAAGSENSTATDRGTVAAPFAGVTLDDGDIALDEELTVTISYLADDGDFVLGDISAATSVMSSFDNVTGIITWTFVGSSAALTDILQHRLTFDPTDRDTAGPEIVTNFTITIDDGFHTPISNSDVTVTATVNGPPVNAPPTIGLEPNGQTTWTIPDNGTVAPFYDLIFADSEDGASGDQMTVVITFAGSQGNFENVPAQFNYTAGDDVLTVFGNQQEINDILKFLRFNPTNRPSDTLAERTDFTIQLTDSQGSSATTNVFVDAAPSGDAFDNLAPTIAVGSTAPIPADDWGPIATVTPFSSVTITDGDTADALDELLTVKVSFINEHGKVAGDMSGAASASSIVDPNGLRIWTFTGKAAALTLMLQGLTFDPTERDAPGLEIDTQFTITVQDGLHFPAVSNDQIHVITTVSGPDPVSPNDIHHVYAVGDIFNEDRDPAIGGIDKAIVHDIDGQFILDANDGIETIEADVGNTAGINVKGNDLANLIIGGQFADILEGGGVIGPALPGNQDVLRGEGGSDTYVINADGVVVDETKNGDGFNDAGGTDDRIVIGNLVAFDATWNTYTLGQFVEHLDARLSTGAVTLNGNGLGNEILGNASANTLVGGAGNDTLDGGVGVADRLEGGADDDTYYVHHAADEVIEADGAGTDTVRLDGVAFDAVWSAYTLADFVETLDGSQSTGAVTLTGNASTNLIVGNASANTLVGLGGNDTLDGGAGAGADRLEGGLGADTYRIHHIDDVIVETDDGETDTVEVFLTGEYHLAADAKVEVLRAGTGVNGVHLVGNTFSASIFGSTGDDTISGGYGTAIVHTLNGGLGDDVYYIVNAGDVVDGELDGGGGGTANGNDTAWVYRGLYQNKTDAEITAIYTAMGIENVQFSLENLPPSGGNTAPTNLRFTDDTIRENFARGNIIGQFLADNAGTFSWALVDDAGGRVSLSASGDLMVKNQTKIDNELAATFDVIVELSDGTTTVQFTKTLTIINLQKETVNGLSTDIQGIGIHDFLRGGAGNDTLNGSIGNDTLSGGGGADRLNGGAGDDAFRFDAAITTSNRDSIVQFNLKDPVDPTVQGDRIELLGTRFAGITADLLSNGVVKDSAFHLGATATEASHRILYDQTTGEIWYDRDGVGGTGPNLIATIISATKPVLTNDYFHVI